MSYGSGGVSGHRARWLAGAILPHEPALRAWLQKRRVIGLEIDDIIQETYAVLASRVSIEDIRNPRAYAFQVARSVIAMHVRRSRVVSIQSVGDVASFDIVADEATPEERVVDVDAVRKLKMHIGDLPPLTRAVMALRIEKDMSQRDIGAQLGISENAAQKHIAKGLKMVAAAFALGGKGLARASSAQTDEEALGHESAAKQR